MKAKGYFGILMFFSVCPVGISKLNTEATFIIEFMEFRYEGNEIITTQSDIKWKTNKITNF